jgi:hypothetical protein
MSYRDWYTFNEDGSDFVCVAVDKDFEVTKQYKIFTTPGSTALGTCECFAGHTWCRHKKMLVEFRKKDLVGKRLYYNYDKNKWLTMPTQES